MLLAVRTLEEKPIEKPIWSRKIWKNANLENFRSLQKHLARYGKTLEVNLNESYRYCKYRYVKCSKHQPASNYEARNDLVVIYTVYTSEHRFLHWQELALLMGPEPEHFAWWIRAVPKTDRLGQQAKRPQFWGWNRVLSQIGEQNGKVVAVQVAVNRGAHMFWTVRI